MQSAECVCSGVEKEIKHRKKGGGRRKGGRGRGNDGQIWGKKIKRHWANQTRHLRRRRCQRSFAKEARLCDDMTGRMALKRCSRSFRSSLFVFIRSGPEG